jgi:hypothetical protein
VRPNSEVYADAVERDQRLANLLLIDAWTGLRWSELRAIRVRDFVEVPMPVLVVQRAAPEGIRVKVTKSGRSRRSWFGPVERPGADMGANGKQTLANDKGSISRVDVAKAWSDGIRGGWS